MTSVINKNIHLELDEKYHFIWLSLNYQVAFKREAGDKRHCTPEDIPASRLAFLEDETRRLLLIIYSSTVLRDLFTSPHDFGHTNPPYYGRRFSLVPQLDEWQGQVPGGQVPELTQKDLVLT